MARSVRVYGSCPPGSDKSYTEIEYDTAVNENKIRFMFLATEDFPVPANLTETPEERQRLRSFRQRVMSESRPHRGMAPILQSQNLGTRSLSVTGKGISAARAM